VIEAFVGIGSNVERERRIREGLGALSARFGALRLSPVYESAAVGFRGNPFYNLVACFQARLPVRGLLAELRAIERFCGRDPAAPKFAPRPLDLDLLLYGDLVVDEPGLKLPRPDILQYGFALKPLADLVPDRRHPLLGRSYAQLWAGFEGEGRELRTVLFAAA
jgi:2-amino-4-hydroxy-6-hydroxymethyldihydropteridine diphosphokinase